MPVPIMKRCSSCGQNKPHKDFHHSKGTKDGLQGNCKSCNTAQAQAAEWKNAGINIDEAGYQRLLESQGGKCAICGAEKSHGGKRLAVDHVHLTGIIRGLLCTDCNTGIGILGDDPDRLRNAADYVQRHRIG